MIDRILLNDSSRLPIYCVRPRDESRLHRGPIRSSANMAKRDLLQHFFRIPISHDKYSGSHMLVNYENLDYNEKHIYSPNGQYILPDKFTPAISDEEFRKRYLESLETRLDEIADEVDIEKGPKYGFDHLALHNSIESDLILDIDNTVDSRRSLEEIMISPMVTILRNCYSNKLSHERNITIYNEKIIHEPLTEEIYQGKIIGNYVTHLNNQPVAIMDVVRYDIPIWIGMKLHFGVMDRGLERQIEKWKQPTETINFLKEEFYDAFFYGFRNCVSLGVGRLTLFDGYYFMFFEFSEDNGISCATDSPTFVKLNGYKMVKYNQSEFTARACFAGFNWYTKPLEEQKQAAQKIQNNEILLGDHFKNLNIISIGASTESLIHQPNFYKAQVEFHRSNEKVDLELSEQVIYQLESDIFKIQSKLLSKYSQVRTPTALLMTFVDYESYKDALQAYIRCQHLQGVNVPFLIGYGTNFYTPLKKCEPYFIIFEDLLSNNKQPSESDREHFLMACVSYNRISQCGVRHVYFQLKDLRIYRGNVLFAAFPGKPRQMENLPALLSIWSGIDLPQLDTIDNPLRRLKRSGVTLRSRIKGLF